jgi:hypothetical protein
VEFELDPSSGRYTKRRLKSEPTLRHGYAGFGQELTVRRLGRTLCSVFVYRQEIVFRVGDSAWNLFEPGLEIAHREGLWHCELSVNDPGGTRTTFRYRRKDSLLVIIDSTYDNLDFELANLPANLPSLAGRDKGELVAEWSALAAVQPGAPADGSRPADSPRG